jgi:hypothetical protein
MKCGLSITVGLSLQISYARKPIHIHGWLFYCMSRWKLVALFVAEIGFLLLADNGNLHTATNLYQAYFCYQLFAAGAPLIWRIHIFG